MLHAVDAVASRDLALRLLSAAAIAGVTLSRLAADLQLWSTAEFDFLRFPDTLVGSSSMMPQKRNPFLLEHIAGGAAAPLGAFVASAAAMHATPFSNSVAVGTEAMRPVWNALDRIADALILARLVVEGAQPQETPMRQRAEDGCTCATELANRLVLDEGVSFRQAHHAVGAAVAEACRRGDPLMHTAARLFARGASAIADPETVAMAAAFGGGPAPASTGRALAHVRCRLAALTRALLERSHRWRRAARALDAAAAALTA